METWKKWTIAILGVLIAALLSIQALLSTTAPSPQPSGVPSSLPSSSMSSSPSPIPSGTPSASASPNGTQQMIRVATRNVKESPNWDLTQHLYASRNETPYLLAQNNGIKCVTLGALPTGITAQIYSVEMFTTKSPSFKGARVGDWADPLRPVSDICPGEVAWIDLAVGASVPPGNYTLGVGDASITLSVGKMVMPSSPTMPLYMEMGGFVAMQAQGYDRNSQVSVEGPVHQMYNKILRANLVEPIKQAIVSFPADINTWSAQGGSWKQLVLDGRIAPPCLFGPTGTYGGGGLYNASNLTRIQSMITSGVLPADSWGYVRDEDAAQYDSAIIPIFQQLQQLVPGMRRMMTENRDSLDPYVTDPVEDFESYNPAKKRANFWLYGACQSQGSCANGYQGTPTGSPMMLIDSPGAHQRAFPIVGALAGAKAMLYYNTTQALMTAWTDQYLFGGNGDGTLLYPSKEMIPPIESVRLKLIRQGMYDSQYMFWTSKQFVDAPLAAKLAVKGMTATEKDLEDLHTLEWSSLQ